MLTLCFRSCNHFLCMFFPFYCKEALQCHYRWCIKKQTLFALQSYPEADGLHAGSPWHVPGAQWGCRGLRGLDRDHVQCAAQQQLLGPGQRGKRNMILETKLLILLLFSKLGILQWIFIQTCMKLYAAYCSIFSQNTLR